MKRIFSRSGLLLLAGGIFIIQSPVLAQVAQIPKISVNVGPSQGSGDLSSTLQIVFILTILSLAPAIMMLLTGFTRIVIVLGFTRSALGTQQIPPNSVLIGLALFLTAFTMAPTAKLVNSDALQPYMSHKIDIVTAQQRAILPIRAFMFRQTRESDLELFVRMAKMNLPKTQADIPMYVLVPSFVISELKTAFTIGFFIFIPFVVIDLVVATVLMSMGMMMMPPIMISLPCKIMLFVLINGWSLIAQGLVTSFHY